MKEIEDRANVLRFRYNFLTILLYEDRLFFSSGLGANHRKMIQEWRDEIRRALDLGQDLLQGRNAAG